MAKLIFTLSASDSLEFPLDAGLTRMGRKPDNDIVINNTWISGHHAEFRWDAGRLQLKDLDSSNGTSVNGERISERELKDGDRISFGQLEAIYHGDVVESPASVQSGSAPANNVAQAARVVRPGVKVMPRLEPASVKPASGNAPASALAPSPSPVPPVSGIAKSNPIVPPAVEAEEQAAPVVVAKPMAPPSATIAYDQARKEMSAELEEIQNKTSKAIAEAATARTAMEAAQAELAQVRNKLEEAKTQFVDWQKSEETARTAAVTEAEAANAIRAARQAGEESGANRVLSGLVEAIAQKRQELAAGETVARQRAAAIAGEAQAAAAGVAAELDEAKSALVSATAELAQSRADLEKIRQETGVASIQLAKLQADTGAAATLLQAREAEAGAAAENLKLQQAETGKIRQEWESIQASRESAQAELTRMEAELAIARTSLETIRQEAAGVEAEFAPAQAAAQAVLERLKQESAGISARNSSLESAAQAFEAEAATWPVKREAAAAELAAIQKSVEEARDAALAEDRKMSVRIKAVEQLEYQHNVLAAKITQWQEKEKEAERHAGIIQALQKDLDEATARQESTKREIENLTNNRSSLTGEIKTLESRLETLRRDTEGAESLNNKVTDLRQQQAEAERRLEFLHDRLSGMSEAPDPNWGTVHSLARSFIRKLDLIDDLITHLEGNQKPSETLTQLQVLRSGLQDILKEYSIEAYSLEPGTVIDVAARKRIQIVETLSEGSHDGTRIVRTYRPGYVCQNGDLGIPTLLRKADVAVSIAMS